MKSVYPQAGFKARFDWDELLFLGRSCPSRCWGNSQPRVVQNSQPQGWAGLQSTARGGVQAAWRVSLQVFPPSEVQTVSEMNLEKKGGHFQTMPFSFDFRSIWIRMSHSFSTGTFSALLLNHSEIQEKQAGPNYLGESFNWDVGRACKQTERPRE